MHRTPLDSVPRCRKEYAEVLPEQEDKLLPAFGLELPAEVLELLPSIARDIKRIADKLDPPPADIVGSRYLADQLGQTTTWVAEMARNGTIPKDCIVPGTGNGKPWKFYRTKIDAWLTRR